jgi:uncharacterized protein (DUF58 family)
MPSPLDPKILSRIMPLGFRARRIVEGSISGLHRSPLHGVSVEFANYREYTPGDDLKRLDWRAYARSNRFHIKQYEEESDLRATIILDASASMRYGRESMTKFDYAATLAASLAMLLVRQRDAVGLAVFDEAERAWLRPAATHAQLAKIIDILEKTKPNRRTDLATVMNKVAGQIKRRGVVIIVSDLLTDLDAFYQSLGRLQYQGHEILIFQILDADEIDLPFQDSILFRDIEPEAQPEELFAEPWAFRKAYKAAMEKFIGDVKTRCQYAGMDHLMLRTSDDLGAALSFYLHSRGSGAGSSRSGKVSEHQGGGK